MKKSKLNNHLKTNIRKIICYFSAFVILCTTILPLIISCNNSPYKVSIADNISNVKVKNQTINNDDFLISLSCLESNKEVSEIDEITIDNNILEKSNYTFDYVEYKITIKNFVVNRYGNNIVIFPKVENKDRKYTVNVDTKYFSRGNVTGGGIFSPNSVVTVVASPLVYSTEKYDFSGWYDNEDFTGDCISTEATYTFSVHNSVKLWANFSKICSVSVQAKDTDRGYVTGNGEIEEGSETTIIAHPIDGYGLLGWFDNESCEGNAISNDLSYTFKVKEDTKYYAKFESICDVNVSSIDTKKGKVEGSRKAVVGSDVTVVAIPSNGFGFCGWFDNAECVGSAVSFDSNYTFKVTKDINLWAKFAPFNPVVFGYVGFKMVNDIETEVSESEAEYFKVFCANDDRTLAKETGGSLILPSKYTTSSGLDKPVKGLYYNKEKNLGAFENCTCINSVTFNSNITSIGENAFKSCSSLKHLTIPDSISAIEKNAINSSVESVLFNNRERTWISKSSSSTEEFVPNIDPKENAKIFKQENFEFNKKEWYLDDYYLKYLAVTPSKIGTKEYIKFNNLTYPVRLIGRKHDVDENNKSINTTWEFCNLICDEKGYSMGYQWHDTDNSIGSSDNFLDSSIRKILCGSGNFAGDVYCATVESSNNHKWDDKYKNRTILSMFEEPFRNAIKTVKKRVFIRQNSEFIEKVFTDKLFLLSPRELCFTQEIYDTGQTYEYYYKYSCEKNQLVEWKEKLSFNTIPKDQGQAFKDEVTTSAGIDDLLGDHGGIYWTRSLISWDKPHAGAWCVDYDATMHRETYLGDVASFAYSIAPAFCL